MSTARRPLRKRLSPKGFTPTGGAYSHGLEVSTPLGVFVFVTGQLSIDPTSEVVGDGDVAAQARYVVSNVERVLAEADATFADVVDARLFMLSMEDYPRVAPLLPEPVRKALAALEVTSLAREGCTVELEVTAFRPTNARRRAGAQARR